MRCQWALHLIFGLCLDFIMFHLFHKRCSTTLQQEVLIIEQPHHVQLGTFKRNSFSNTTCARKCKDFFWLTVALAVAPAISTKVFDKFVILYLFISTVAQGKSILPSLALILR